MMPDLGATFLMFIKLPRTITLGRQVNRARTRPGRRSLEGDREAIPA
jgi:hypothetical protein